MTFCPVRLKSFNWSFLVLLRFVAQTRGSKSKQNRGGVRHLLSGRYFCRPPLSRGDCFHFLLHEQKCKCFLSKSGIFSSFLSTRIVFRTKWLSRSRSKCRRGRKQFHQFHGSAAVLMNAVCFWIFFLLATSRWNHLESCQERLRWWRILIISSFIPI